jgi:uncharacterized radical SAM superfamily Fe-S cluster-containing enzyme
MTERQEKAYKLLISKQRGDFSYLGEGATSVVFTDYNKIYKVFLGENLAQVSWKNGLLKHIKDNAIFQNTKYFYPIEEIIPIDNNQIYIYKYDISEPCTYFSEIEIIDFLIECWDLKLIFKDVKPKNFIRVNGSLKFIDYDPEPYNDNFFMNMAARAFIYCKHSDKEYSYLQKLCRTAINNFDLIELQGFQEFLNYLFAKIIYQKSQIETTKIENCTIVNDVSEIVKRGIYKLLYQDNFNAEQAFWQLNKLNIFLDKSSFDTPILDEQNYFSPQHIILKTEQIVQPKQNVSLIIKACVQDTEIIYEAVKHIVRQLTFPNNFAERILALDIRQTDFLREYNSKNTWEILIEEAQKLVDDFVIDKFIFPTENEFQNINQKWFGIETNATHTIKKVPVTAQLYAFEKAKNDFVLQVDCDAMIGRNSKEHSFLDDMISEFDKNESVLSVGFNIYKGKKTSFTSYFGFENGGFVPEVRFCLLKKSRIENVLPLKNEIVENAFKVSWYRALEQRQKQTQTCSIRGGDSRSFFIHPYNFKKTDKDVWFTTLDRVEQLEIPEKQTNEFDIAGSYYDWTISKRNEKLVIISYFRNIPFSRFLRFWYSLTSQTNQDWGLVLIDDASDNGISHFIKELIKPFQNRNTFIQNRFHVGAAQNTYKAIHYFIENQESVVCVLNAGDALIGKNALDVLMEKYKYWKGDLAIGKSHYTTKIDLSMPTHDFSNPRKTESGVANSLISFKKYLYDSLTFEDFKVLNKEENWDKGVLLSKLFTKKLVFPKYASQFSYIVPIVEMSVNPKFTDYINHFKDKNIDIDIQILNDEISEIISKPSKRVQDSFKGRRTFLPNLKKIELDITYECNLKCINCNRSSTQAPIKDGMSIEQIEKFVEESIELNIKWELINILGGEPTVHKDFHEIVSIILYKYLIPHSPNTLLQVTSNGYGEIVIEKLNKMPKHPRLIIETTSFKDDRIVSYFSPFNDAPIDKPNGNEKEYHKGCWVTSYCGIGLNHLGYYPCGVAGGIDRVFKLNLGVQSLKNVDESIAKYLDTFCRFCGNFSDYESNAGNFIPRNEKSALTKPVISESWRKAYKDYNGK